MLKRKLTMLAAGLALSLAGLSAAVAQMQTPAA